LLKQQHAVVVRRESELEQKIVDAILLQQEKETLEHESYRDRVLLESQARMQSELTFNFSFHTPTQPAPTP
jgi:hypothetical protein